MHSIFYDVAVSIDGFIAGPDGDISRFPAEGQVLDDYLKRLSRYKTAIMGRETYLFGTRFGMSLGENPYPHMRTVVVSRSLNLPKDAQVEVWRTTDGIADLRSDGDVYLCGGGRFAGWCLTNRLIDRIRLKRGAMVLGGGTPLFVGVASPPDLRLRETRDYGDGCVFQDFDVVTAKP